MRFLYHKIPPPIVTLLFAAALWAFAKYLPEFDLALRWRIIGAVLLLASGFLFSLAGVVSFRKARTTVNPLKPNTASSLVSSGIYRYSRNPMYVGMALVLIAWVWYLASPLLLIGVVGFVFYMNRFQIVPEERAMLTLFGEDFTRYQNNVRRWL